MENLVQKRTLSMVQALLSCTLKTARRNTRNIGRTAHCKLQNVLTVVNTEGYLYEDAGFTIIARNNSPKRATVLLKQLRADN